MSGLSTILDRLTGSESGSPLFLPDLTGWYAWHARMGTLPDGFAGLSLAGVCGRLGVPVWRTVAPWHREMMGIKVDVAESETERATTYTTPSGNLSDRWTRGPDGDWWQAEHLVNDRDDLRAALELAQSYRYTLETSELERALDDVGDRGVVAAQLPRRPFSDLLHDYLGWGEGLSLLYDEPDLVRGIVEALEESLADVEAHISDLPTLVFLSPDNLDGQYISPRSFSTFLSASYERLADRVHRASRQVLVHAGGPVRRLLPLLADVGIDGCEGVAPAPQGDASLAESREGVGPDFTLWGGVPQDVMLASSDLAAADEALRQSLIDARGDTRCIIGIADRVPVDADISRLERAIESLR